MSAETADNAGTPQSKRFHMASIKEFPRGILDQVISKEPATAGNQRAPGPGLKLQAPSVKLSNQPVQAPSDKHPIQNNKRQASSLK